MRRSSASSTAQRTLCFAFLCACSASASGTAGNGGAVSAASGGVQAGATDVGGATSPGSGGTSGSGGSAHPGGATGMGGLTSTGGGVGTGGVVSSAGGTLGTGGATSTGGRLGAGGGIGAGGALATGGGVGAGGAPSTGGATGTGGRPGAGGVTGAGGATSTAAQAPYKGVANSPKDQLAALGATWCYNWGTSPKASECADPLFVPMVWGKDNVASAIKAIGNAGYKVVLGFNEPNKADQANMTVDEAIALWPTLTSNPDIRVGSPAVSDDGRAWLVSFMTQVKQKGLRVDFIAMHWYGWNAGSCVSSQLEGAITWASQWNLPIWITEFGCMGSSDPDDQTVIDFFTNAIPMVKKHPLVERYAWYPWNTHNYLYSQDASAPVMTTLGKSFVAAPPYR